MPRILAIIAALFFGTLASAHEYKVGDLAIVHPTMPAPAANASTAAGYFTIINHGETADSLTGITAGFAEMSMLHQSKVDDSGVATMDHVPALNVPAGATVTLEPGALHIMFMGLKGPIAEGDMLPATLTFEKAGSVGVEFKVDAKGAAHDMTMPMN